MSTKHLLFVMVISACLHLAYSQANRMQSSGVREYCETETFSAICAKSEVLVMQTARYGRMRLGRCVRKDLGYIGCYTDVLHLADRRCSGRHECDIRIPDPQFDTSRPCLEELKTYFEASYVCQKVWTPEKGNCDSEKKLILTSTSGFLASVITLNTGCGSPQHPFRIEAEPGQKVNISLTDFMVDTPTGGLDHESHEHPDDNACRVYAVVEDLPGSKRKAICAGKSRHKHVYLSSNNTVEIRLLPLQGGADVVYFGLEYNVVGCPDFNAPDSMWVKRTDDGAEVGCKSSAQIWRLRCIGTTWTGMIGNCSHYEILHRDKDKKPESRMSYGTSVAIIFLIAFIIGVFVFAIGFISFRKSRCRRTRERPRQSKSGHLPFRKTEITEAEVEMKDKPCHEMIKDVGTSEFIQVPGHKGHHARMMKVDGNDYAHIWESPLPLPLTLQQIEHELKHHSHGDRRLSQPEVCCKDQTLDIIQGSSDCETCETMPRMKKKGPNNFSYETPRYFVLDRDAVIAEGSPTHVPAHAPCVEPQGHASSRHMHKICIDPRDPRAQHRNSAMSTRKNIK